MKTVWTQLVRGLATVLVAYALLLQSFPQGDANPGMSIGGIICSPSDDAGPDRTDDHGAHAGLCCILCTQAAFAVALAPGDRLDPPASVAVRAPAVPISPETARLPPVGWPPAPRAPPLLV
ncbi:DUF2946 family protein [Chthonobacter albigriseus]|uniref:DUF2946 family protein n=1 Tax=Chthonobacter albigriseus TaxID=1683161 RepID=UPI0015EE9A01|nr:DUF2946 family protein [Chthonobacter albigriseus]